MRVLFGLVRPCRLVFHRRAARRPLLARRAHPSCEVFMNMKSLPVRNVSIECIDHLDWGSWGVYEDRGDYYEIHGRRGSRVLFKDEAEKFWRVVK